MRVQIFFIAENDMKMHLNSNARKSIYMYVCFNILKFYLKFVLIICNINHLKKNPTINKSLYTKEYQIIISINI